MCDGPALLGLAIHRVVERVRLTICLTAALEPLAVPLVGVAALVSFDLRRIDMTTIVTTVDDALVGPPVAATVELASVAPKPVVSHPPAVRVVLVGAVAVSALIFLVRISHIAVLEVLIAILSLTTTI